MTEEKTALSPSNPAQHLTTDITIEDVAEQVRSWLQAARTRSVPAPAKLLSDLLRDPHGLEFTLAFVDRVIRPEDPRAAAVELRRLAQDPHVSCPPRCGGWWSSAAAPRAWPRTWWCPWPAG